MGFWHTGYFEHHELMSEGLIFGDNIAPPSFPCEQCGQEFARDTDLRLHVFDGHPTTRPVLLFRGRECSQGPLRVSGEIEPDDWKFLHVVEVTLGTASISPSEAAIALSQLRAGAIDLTLHGREVSREVEVIHRIVEDADLDGVDAAAKELTCSEALTLGAIQVFEETTASYLTARDYAAGVSNYLYGVLAREDSPQSGLLQQGADAYREKYQRAVFLLGGFDRPAAEAICGMVAFHHNDFATAMRKTHSERVAAVSLRLQAIAMCTAYDHGDLSRLDAVSLDHAFSDAPTEGIIDLCAGPLDGSDSDRIARIESALRQPQQPLDDFKLRLVAAEHYLAVEDPGPALRLAEPMRNGRGATWYAGVRERAER